MTPHTEISRAAAPAPSPASPVRTFFSVHAAGAMFGLPVDAVQTIFRLQAITPVPLGPPTVAGLVNLRGKIVTAISLARRLALEGPDAKPAFAVAVECRGETFALLVDAVGDAMECGPQDRLESPPHIDARRARVTAAYYRVENGILPVLDVEALFDAAAIRAVETTQPVHSAPISEQ